MRAHLLRSRIDSSLSQNIESKGHSQLYGNQVNPGTWPPGSPALGIFFFYCKKIYIM